MQIPPRRNLDAIDRVLLGHYFRMVRINLATDVISADHLRIAHGLNRRDRRRRRGTDGQLRARGALGNEHEWNESKIFHGLMGVEVDGNVGGTAVSAARASSFAEPVTASSANGFSEPPISASAQSIVCTT